MNVAIGISHARVTAACCGATSATNRTEDGSKRQPSNTRAQKCDRRPMASQDTTQTATKASSTATNRTIISET